MFKLLAKLVGMIMIITLLNVSAIFAQESSRKNISDLFTVKEEMFRADDHLKNAVLLDMDEDYLGRIYHEANFAVKMQVPLSYDKAVTVEMETVNILSSDFILRSSSGDTLNYERGIYYRGSIKDHDGFCTIAVFEDHVMGIVSIKGMGDFNLGKLKGKRNTDYIVYNDRNLSREQVFECHTPDPPMEAFEVIEQDPGQRYSTCVKVYIEGDYALFQDKGSVAAASNYITGLFNQVAALYDDESIGIEISEIMVWDTPDGYSTTSAGTALDQFADNNPTFNGDLAQLFALGGNGLGGLAWVDVLCGWSPYAYENISSSYNDYPDYSWSVEVVAHEMGHNFGSRHTHACVWNGNNTQIDDCGNEYANNNGQTPEGNACYDSNNPILPNSGTVMSYCHLLWSVGIDLANGFGQQPGDKIRSEYNSASCLGACTGGIPDPPIADFDSDDNVICEGDPMQYYDLSTNDPTEWEWTFEGGSPPTSDEENPFIFYDCTGFSSSLK